MLITSQFWRTMAFNSQPFASENAHVNGRRKAQKVASSRVLHWHRHSLFHAQFQSPDRRSDCVSIWHEMLGIADAEKNGTGSHVNGK
jgi:hypothetical protein